jgi:hypothetical protein
MRRCHPLLSTGWARSRRTASVLVRWGGAEGTRTPDPHTASATPMVLPRADSCQKMPSAQVNGTGLCWLVMPEYAWKRYVRAHHVPTSNDRR